MQFVVFRHVFFPQNCCILSVKQACVAIESVKVQEVGGCFHGLSRFPLLPFFDQHHRRWCHQLINKFRRLFFVVGKICNRKLIILLIIISNSIAFQEQQKWFEPRSTFEHLSLWRGNKSWGSTHRFARSFSYLGIRDLFLHCFGGKVEDGWNS